MADKSVEYYQQRLRKAEGDALFAANNGNADQQRVFLTKLEAAKLDLARAEAAAGGTPPANSVDTSTSPAARTAQAPANEAGSQTVKQSTPESTENTYVSRAPIENDYGDVVQSQSPADLERQRRINESLERSAYLDSLENGTEYVPGEATGDLSFGYTPPDPPPSAIEPDPPISTGFGGGRGSVVEQPGERAAASTAGYSDPTPTPPLPQPERTTPVPVGESRETILGGYESEARAEATATRLIAREQSEARAEGREPANYEVVETTDDGFVIQKVSEGEATPAATGFGGGRGSVVEQPRERAAASADDPVVNEYDEFGDIGRDVNAPPASTATSVDPVTDPVVNEYDEFGDIGRDVNEPPTTAAEDVDPVTDPVVNEYDEFGDIEERDLSAPPEAVEAEDVDEDPQAEIYDEFGDIERDLQNPDSLVAEPIDDEGYPGEDPFAEEQFGVVNAPTATDDEPEIVDFDADDTADYLDREAERERAAAAAARNAQLQRLREQSIVRQTRNDSPGDWRVKLRLASESQNFYKAPVPGILAPLRATDGVVFPYTPTIQTLYSAEYQQYQPTHSNYQNYFYKGSRVQEIVLTGTFTAQDTEEANYLLAVIHFFRSTSKMFYGQDKERGSPPPLLFLSGLGQHMFNEAPCVISQFNITLPNDVDYIRAQPDGKIKAGSLQSDLRNKGTGGATWSSSVNRLLNSDLFGKVEKQEAFSQTGPVSLSSDSASYVPTKIEMTISLLPVQNRLQVSEGFSLKDYANGGLITRGYW